VPRVELRAVDATLSRGPDAARLAKAGGLELDPWQRLALDAGMGEQADGQWAASEVDVLTSRQNGKNGIVEPREEYGAVVLGESIIHTAHLFKTTRESYNRLLSLILADPDVAAELTHQVASPASGYEMQFRSGGRVQFIARSRTSGRGLSGDVLVLDEAQDLDDDDLAALLPTISASSNPQTWYLGSAPWPHSSVWHRRRKSGRDGVGRRRFFCEFSADPNADLDDPAALAQANPGLGYRLSLEAVAAERSSMSDETFARERLSISPDLPEEGDGGDFDVDVWLSFADPAAERGSRPVFGVDVGGDRLAHVAVAWRRPDDRVQVMISDSGLSPLRTPERLAQLASTWKGPVMLGGTSTSLEGDVPGAAMVSAAEFASACGRFDDLLRDGQLRHGNQPELNEAVKAAEWRPFSTAGERTLQLKDAPMVGPLAAVVRALHGLLAGKAKPVAAPATEKVPTARVDGDLSTIGF
jgi:phage terminase large subunit-like protein